jgi:hypothetical protein
VGIVTFQRQPARGGGIVHRGRWQSSDEPDHVQAWLARLKANESNSIRFLPFLGLIAAGSTPLSLGWSPRVDRRVHGRRQVGWPFERPEVAAQGITTSRRRDQLVLPLAHCLVGELALVTSPRPATWLTAVAPCSG